MSVEDAIKKLESSSPHDRLLGARHFSKIKASQGDIVKLRRFLKKERVTYVRNALELAIKRSTLKDELGELLAPAPDEEEGTKRPKDEVSKWVGILLHEVEPKVGLIQVSAEKEISNYDDSDTKKNLKALEKIIEGFSDLRKTILTPNSKEIDLAVQIKNIANQEVPEGVDILYSGKKPFLIKSDPNLLEMAISNGIRNAVEAVLETEGKRIIVVSWDQTDVDYSVIIMDNGRGFELESSTLFKIGKSTKERHGGFGLTIIRKAMENLDGSVKLTSSKLGGAKLELKWCK